MKEKALEYLRSDFLLNVDMIECINRDICDLLYAERDGVLLYVRDSDVYMLSCDSTDAALRITDGIDSELLWIHQLEQTDALCAAHGYRPGEPCWQAVYTKAEPLDETWPDIRRLDSGYAQLVSQNYHNGDFDYVNLLISRGEIYGVFADGALAGFVGCHSEGSVGLLEVLPEYRRRGLGEALERNAINRALEAGWTPYGQVFCSNEVSRRLQEKLGMEFSDKYISWLWKNWQIST